MSEDARDAVLHQLDGAARQRVEPVIVSPHFEAWCGLLGLCSVS